jgi:hypothetical protein
MAKRALPLVLAIVLAVTLPASGAGPDEPPATISSTARALTATPSFAGTSETSISGMTYDNDVNPLGDVSVKLYIGGVLAAETKTSLDGRFEMTHLIDHGRDVTIDLWFVADDPSLLMENVLLKESSTAIKHSLYSKCMKRVTLAPITDVVIKLTDVKTRADRLKRLDCL